MAGLHTRKTIIFAYTAGFLGILGCILIKQRTHKLDAPDVEISVEAAVEAMDVEVEPEEMDVEVSEMSEKPRTFAEAVEKKFAAKRAQIAEEEAATEKAPAPKRARVTETPVLSGEGTYRIRTRQGLEDFVVNPAYQNKPIVVNFSNIKACDPCKANRPTYLLSAKFLPDKAYFVEIEENDFDDNNYFVEHAPMIPAFEIYKDGTMVKSFAGKLKSRTQIRDELNAL